ncbi:hypothetical protein LCGC14_1053050 [marine sediment metagenome]|uniref:Rad50/SbcC-type AAA domain-containing protein n=1 Tax=marine sediment metagenome TaxID=412755 RepID=A0A0F9QUE3_9ZZZZ
MKITLKSLAGKNFKGQREFFAEFGKKTRISGENGSGKTTIYDMFLWLRGGKDSDGRADFAVRPLDAQNQPVNGLTVSVTAVLGVNDQTHTYRKDQTERLSKKIVKGFTNEYWIDEVPMSEKEFDEHNNRHCEKEVFRILTDLRYFCADEKHGGMHWNKNRSILTDCAGDIPQPEGFEELLNPAFLKGRSIDQMKKVLKDRKVLLEKEVGNSKNPGTLSIQIGEVKTGMVDCDSADAEVKRKFVKQNIKGIEGKRTVLLDSEKERAEKAQELIDLKSKRGEREVALKTDTSGIKKYIDEKAEIEKMLGDAQAKATKINDELGDKLYAVCQQEKSLDRANKELDEIRQKRDNFITEPANDICFNCKQKLPPDMIVSDESRDLDKANIMQEGKTKAAEIKFVTGNIDTLNGEIKVLQDRYTDAEKTLDSIEESKGRRFAELDQMIAENPTKNPATDTEWNKLNAAVHLKANEIGEPATEKLKEIELELWNKNSELTKLNEALAQKDRLEQDKARIVELEAEQKEKTQQLLDVEKSLADIQAYKTEESKNIEAAVNGMFRHVKFKLFKELMDGETDTIDCCVATLRGVAYPDMSYGEKKFAEVDIINTLSKHYDADLPLFIDNAEGLTLPIEFDGQLISLFAVEGQKELKVENA